MLEGVLQGVFQENTAQMADLLSRYQDYKRVDPSEITFAEPANTQEKIAVRKLKTKNIALTGVASLAAITLTVLSIVQKSQLSGILIMAGFTAVCLGFFYSCVSQKAGALSGKAIYKDYKRVTGKQNTFMYYTTVVIDEPEKWMCRVSTTKSVYEALEEGKEVIVVQVGNSYYATLK